MVPQFVLNNDTYVSTNTKPQFQTPVVYPGLQVKQPQQSYQPTAQPQERELKTPPAPVKVLRGGGNVVVGKSYMKPNLTPQQKQLCQQLLSAPCWQDIVPIVLEAKPENLNVVIVATAWSRLGKLAANNASQEQLRGVISRLKQRVQAIMDQLDGRNTAIVAHAVARLVNARLQAKDVEFMNQLAERAVQPDVLPTFNAQSVANMAWAFAKSGLMNIKLMDALAGRYLPTIGDPPNRHRKSSYIFGQASACLHPRQVGIAARFQSLCWVGGWVGGGWLPL